MVNPKILIWARETAGLDLAQAAKMLGFQDTERTRGADRLASLENGEKEVSEGTLLKMARKYRRPLTAFYLEEPPARGDRGEDFRSLPDKAVGFEHHIDALVRDVRARQSIIKDLLENDEDTKPLPFIASMTRQDGVSAVVNSIRRVLGTTPEDFYRQANYERAFALLRSHSESAGIFVLLIGNLGSHHTAISADAFRGFALADTIAPFVVINDQDAPNAWSFTLIHEIAHLWIGQTGVSGKSADTDVEKFCNDVAAEFLLPNSDLTKISVDKTADIETAKSRIDAFARPRNLSHSMVAYRLLRANIISTETWSKLASAYAEWWRRHRDSKKDKQKDDDSGPSYYVVRSHRLGQAIIQTVQQALHDGTITPTRAGKALGVNPRLVSNLLESATRRGKAA